MLYFATENEELFEFATAKAPLKSGTILSPNENGKIELKQDGEDLSLTRKIRKGKRTIPALSALVVIKSGIVSEDRVIKGGFGQDGLPWKTIMLISALLVGAGLLVYRWSSRSPRLLPNGVNFS